MEKIKTEIIIARSKTGKMYIGDEVLLSPVPDTAFGIIAFLEVELERKLKEEIKKEG